MAIAVMTRVWNQAEQKGSQLLLLLAMADNATDESLCWPGTPFLSKKIRMSVRQTQRLLDDLIEQGVLYHIPGGTGRKHFDHYAILIGLSDDEQQRAIELLHRKAEVSPTSSESPYTKGDKMSPIRTNKGRQDVTHKKGDNSERVTSAQEKGDILSEERVTFANDEQVPNTRTDMPQTVDSHGGDPDHEPSDPDHVVVVKQQQQASLQRTNANGNVNPKDSDLVAYLKDKGMTLAHKFAHIPYDVGRADFDARQADGVPIGITVNQWLEKPPTAEVNYGTQSRPAHEPRSAGQLSESGQQPAAPSTNTAARAAPTLRRATVASATGKRDHNGDAPRTTQRNE